jgi:hypothetical protein
MKWSRQNGTPLMSGKILLRYGKTRYVTFGAFSEDGLKIGVDDIRRRESG